MSTNQSTSMTMADFQRQQNAMLRAQRMAMFSINKQEYGTFLNSSLDAFVEAVENADPETLTVLPTVGVIKLRTSLPLDVVQRRLSNLLATKDLKLGTFTASQNNGKQMFEQISKEKKNRYLVFFIKDASAVQDGTYSSKYDQPIAVSPTLL